MHYKISLYWFAVMLVLYEFTTYAANDMIMPGMLQVVEQFNAPLENVALSMSAYILGCGMLQLFVGPLADYYGPRKIIIFGNILFLVLTLLINFANSIEYFMVMRFLQGTGMAFIAIGYNIIHQNFNDKEALKITSLMANLCILAPLLGPVLGGVIVSHFSWHFVFIFIGIMGFISLIGLIKFTPKTIDVEGIKLSVIEMIQIYWKILCFPKFIIGIIASSLLSLPLLLWIALSPTLIMHTSKLGINEYMLYQVIAVGGLMISSILMQFIAGKFSLKFLILFGLCFIGGGLSISIVFYANLLIVTLGLGIYGLGLGLSNGAIMRILATLDINAKNMLFSFLVFIQTITMALGIHVGSVFLEQRAYDLLGFRYIIFTIGFWGIALVLCFTYLNRGRKAI